MPRNASFPRTCDLLVSQKMMQTPFFHPLSPFPGNFCNCSSGGICIASQFKVQLPLLYTMWSNPALRNWAGHDAATSRDFLHERLRRAFTHANQPHWTTQQTAFWNSKRFTTERKTYNAQITVIIQIIYKHTKFYQRYVYSNKSLADYCQYSAITHLFCFLTNQFCCLLLFLIYRAQL